MVGTLGYDQLGLVIGEVRVDESTFGYDSKDMQLVTDRRAGRKSEILTGDTLGRVVCQQELQSNVSKIEEVREQKKSHLQQFYTVFVQCWNLFCEILRRPVREGRFVVG